MANGNTWSACGATAITNAVAGNVLFKAVAKLTLTTDMRRIAVRQPVGRKRPTPSIEMSNTGRPWRVCSTHCPSE